MPLLRENIWHLVLATKLRNAYKKYTIVYPNKSTNIYDKQVTLIYTDYTLQKKQVKSAKSALCNKKRENTILQPSLLLTPTEIHRVSIHGYEAYGPENISLWSYNEQSNL